MPSRAFQVVVGSIVVLALGGIWVVVRLDNARLRPRLDALNREHQQVERLRIENRKLQDIAARTRSDAADGASLIHAELLQARTDVEELERKARAGHERLRTEAAQDAENLANNRDPGKGLVRLEHFQNQGQATPEKAFQTFVWAAMKGEDATLAGMIALDSSAREKGMAVVAALPAEAQAKYPTPEKLAALFFASALTAQPSAQVIDVALNDSQHAIVSVRGLTDKTQRIPLQLGANGWQIVVPPAMVERLGRWATGEAAPRR